MEDVTIHDAESGLDLHYTWDDKSGYSFTVSGYDSKVDMRKAIYLSLKYWPKVPPELKDEIDRHNLEIRNVCRSVVIDYD